VGLADRLDTLVALFGKGKIPTGSADPFALRRAAWTTIALLLSKNVRIPLSDLLDDTLSQFEGVLSADERAGLRDKLLSFFRDRARNLFAETGRPGLPGGIAPDTFDAALGAKASWEDVPGLVSRLQALQGFRDSTEFGQIAETFKRVNNILKDANVSGDAVATTGNHPTETALIEAVSAAGETVAAAVQSQSWDKALEAIATLQKPVADLFVAVMVNDPDETVRANRQAILASVRSVVLNVADFSAFQG
jgi:glycyl-tRNA synthetase beta chain